MALPHTGVWVVGVPDFGCPQRMSWCLTGAYAGLSQVM